MADEIYNRHGSRKARDLFEQDTGGAGSLGDIVEHHAGDTFSLVPERSVSGADSGEADFVSEMNPDDPAEQWETLDDEYLGDDDDQDAGYGETNITGTVSGIARGFGSHVPQDVGKNGFQIEEFPDRAIGRLGRVEDGEELDDYDDEDTSNGKFDSRGLGPLSEPGMSPSRRKGPADENRIVTHDPRPVTFDEALDEGMRER